jgi:cellulose synthase (UDP-forming)
VSAPSAPVRAGGLGLGRRGALSDLERAERAMRVRQVAIRVLIVANLILGTYYIAWRYAASINWAFWPLGLALIAAETYSFVDAWLFGIGMWKWRRRLRFPAKRGDETVDVFITCYNEPVELVRETAEASLKLTHPARVWICDDGNSPAMRAMAEEIGCGYIARTEEWLGKDRHAKAGNLINAIGQTDGEFMLILDADQVPLPNLLDETLGYFRDPKVAFVQTPQWFKNVPPGDPFGSQAPLFYGPIQEAKDGWNAAFFCGSNAVLRREAMLHAGLVNYARDLRLQMLTILDVAGGRLTEVEQSLRAAGNERDLPAIRELAAAVDEARGRFKRKEPLAEVTYDFQRRARAAASRIVAADLADIARELDDIPGLAPMPAVAERLGSLLEDDAAVGALTSREASPLRAFDEIRDLLLKVDVDRAHEAVPVMPLSTISVTEDMATAMRLHSLGYTSVYHPTILAHGLAPEDLRTALQQRLRWAQGTIQVMLRENPLFYPGLKLAQRLMYFATMWSYLSGFFAIVYLASPVVYLLFGWSPVVAFSEEFFWRLIPYLLVNQALFVLVSWGLPTWRGQQYSLALFPIWIASVTSAVGSVFFGQKLGFVVTPKTRQAGASLELIKPQLFFMGALLVAIAVGLGRLAFGVHEDGLPVVVNVLWAIYDLVALSVLLDAVFYRPPADEEALPPDSAASVHGRAGSGGK